MKKRSSNFILLFILLLSQTITAFAQQAVQPQKKPIDARIFDQDGYGNTWAKVGDPVVSADGKYVGYQISDTPAAGKTTTIIAAVSGPWKRTYQTDSHPMFSGDGRWVAIADKDHHQLTLLRPGTDELKEIDSVARFELPRNSNSGLIAYLAGNKVLHLLDLNTGRQQSFSDVDDFTFSPSGDQLVFQTRAGSGRDAVYALYLTNTNNGSSKKLAEETLAFPVGSIVFNAAEKSIAWIHEKKDAKTGAPDNSIYYSTLQSGQTKLLAGPRSIPDSLYISPNGLYFSADGRRLLFSLKQVAEVLPQAPLPDSAVLVDIYRYRDIQDQADQLGSWNEDSFRSPAVITLATGKTELFGGPNRHFDKLDYLRFGVHPARYLLYTNASASENYWWNKSSLPSVFLINMITGAKMTVKSQVSYYPDREDPASLEYHLSPGEQFVLYFDPTGKGYYSYDIASGRTRAISFGINVSSLYDGYADNTNDPQFQHPLEIIGWLKNDKGVLVSDNYDIWLLDLGRKNAPVNVTGGYGRRHHTQFRVYLSERDMENGITEDSRLILASVNELTKHEGFYGVSLSNPGHLSCLSEGPYHYAILAKAGATWIIKRESATEYPNLYTTTDLKSFKALTDIEPQKDYNWLTAELVSYKLPDGRLCQGILYKPENFDPEKKYPLIFYYYEKLTQGLYKFPQPGLSGEEINVPDYVNKGYLVFLPDIWYKVGHPGNSALQSVTTAAQLLCKRSYVDAKRMGLEGHSWGAYETYYIIAHSHLFAAAVAGDGPTDFMSGYGAPRGHNWPAEPRMYEHDQCRIGATPWQRPDLYIENSPVFAANHITTPLLMQHSKNDWLVNFDQGMEMFTALRRLDRKVWLLQYDQGGHGASLPKDRLDFSIRMGQFFDYYLKGAPAPKWMVEGIPAKDKGVDKAYELEPGRTP